MKKPNSEQTNDHLEFEDLFEVEVSDSDIKEYKRLDKFLSDKVEGLSRNVLKNLFERGMITSEGIKLELKKMPPSSCKITIQTPPPLPSKAEAENIPIEILFEDEHLIIVNKPAGMVTHPAPGNYTGTLVNAILYHCPDIGVIGDQKRPGIVHRLDKGTSGVMVIAKNQKTHDGLVTLFSKHDIEREYQCIAMNSKLNQSGKIEANIGRHPTNRLKMSTNSKSSKEAITYYNVHEIFESCSHLKINLETGRTHQIRVHLSEILKAPILNDHTYGNPKQDLQRLPSLLNPILKNYEHPLLHAKKLGFVHPITQENINFETSPPETFQKVLDVLRGDL